MDRGLRASCGVACVLALMACAAACTTAGSASMPARVQVEVDIFSGLPNPTWALTNEEAEHFALRLAALARTSAAPPSSHLGYRGFIVGLTQGATAQQVRLQRGVAQIASGATTVYARDEARQLERWLLSTGKPHLKEDIYQTVERELR